MISELLKVEETPLPSGATRVRATFKIDGTEYWIEEEVTESNRMDRDYSLDLMRQALEQELGRRQRMEARDSR